MPPPYPAGETVTILPPGIPNGQDAYGNDVLTAPAEVDVHGAAVWPGTSSEDAQGRDQLTSDLAVMLPYGTVVAATARMRVRGAVYEVQGEPAVWRSSLTGTKAGVQVRLNRVTG